MSSPKTVSVNRETAHEADVWEEKDACAGVDRIWRTLLATEGLEGVLVARDEVGDVASLMAEYRIDPRKFASNLRALMVDEEMKLSGMVTEFAVPPTTSIHRVCHSRALIDGILLWFLAGFPDVWAWYDDKKGGLYYHSIENDAKDLDVHYWRNLVTDYVRGTGKPLETAFQRGSSDDIYLGSNLLKAVGEESNFTLIASTCS
jgi:hypothetical protein